MKKTEKRGVALALVLLAALAVGLGTGGVLAASTKAPSPVQSQPPPLIQNEEPAVAASVPPQTQPVELLDYQPKPLPEEMRAMWFSFLEWRDLFSAINGAGEQKAEQFTQQVGQMFQNCADMGLNTVIVAVRPFGDALYQSDVFPWSHLVTGAQGEDPGFDPLAIMIQQAHQRDLRLEAWVNPYRVDHPQNGPGTLSADNPATLNPDWVRQVNGELWFDPGIPQVEALVAQGVAEILQRYAVDGIHFDDYFYPSGAKEDFDAASFAAGGGGVTLADWRRTNTDLMVKKVYDTVKTIRPAASFGVSMQGNNENNFTTMYADVKKWMANDGYVGGLYQVGDMKLYVSYGAGLWAGFPLRLGRASEITLASSPPIGSSISLATSSSPWSLAASRANLTNQLF